MSRADDTRACSFTGWESSADALGCRRMEGSRVVAFAFASALASALAATLVLGAAGCTLDLHHKPQQVEGGVPVGSPTSSPSPSPMTNSDGYDQYNGTCPARSTLYGAMHGIGEACATATDCAPSCCPCGTNAKSWLASSCVEGRCVAPTTACQRTAYARPWCAVGVIPPPPSATCGGNAYASPSCDTCFRSKCCADGAACAATSSCGLLRQCESGCADETCMNACASAYPGGTYPLYRLERCLEVQCSVECGYS